VSSYPAKLTARKPSTGPAGKPSTGPAGKPSTGPAGKPSTGPAGKLRVFMAAVGHSLQEVSLSDKFPYEIPSLQE